MSARTTVVDLLRSVPMRFVRDRGPSLAASLTYTTLLALVPLATITLTLITAFPAFDAFSGDTPRFFEQSVLPPAVAHAVLGYVRQFAANAAGLTVVGLASLAAVAFLTMFTIEGAFNHIWRVRRQRPLPVRMLVYVGALMLGPLLVGMSLTITSFLLSASLGYVEQVPGGARFLLAIVPVVLSAVAFTLLYYVVPNRVVALRHAAAGGVVAALLFELVKRGFALYIQYFSSYATVYGAFAAIPLFLIWVYASWVAALLGAVLTALLPERALGRSYTMLHPMPGFGDVVDVLRAMFGGSQRGAPVSTGDIAVAAKLPPERSELALDWLADAGWVERARYGRWRFTWDPEAVTVAEIYDRFVAAQASRRPRDRVIDALLANAAAEARRALDIPLARLGEAYPAKGVGGAS